MKRWQRVFTKQLPAQSYSNAKTKG